MSKSILILACILTFSSSYYLPMKKKSIDFGEGICRYSDTIHHTNYDYVMGCEKGKYCASVGSNYDIYKCMNYTQVIKRLGDECKIDLDCDNNLICVSNKCSIKDGNPYKVGTKYYCPAGQIYNTTTHYDATYNPNAGKCITKTTNTDKCNITIEVVSSPDITNTYNPDYFKVCGKKTFKLVNTVSTAKYYKHMTTEMNYIGELEDGTVVDNVKACKSGFAINLYANGELTKPFTDAEVAGSGGNDKNFLTCVTVKEAEYDSSSNKCRIKFTKGDEKEYTYEDPVSCDEFLMTKLKIWQEYLVRMNSIKEQCESERHYDDPFICNDNELKKLNYFYSNPENYLLYQNDTQVVDYLVQTEYKSYEAQDLSSGLSFLNINYFTLLLLFLISF